MIVDQPFSQAERTTTTEQEFSAITKADKENEVAGSQHLLLQQQQSQQSGMITPSLKLPLTMVGNVALSKGMYLTLMKRKEVQAFGNTSYRSTSRLRVNTCSKFLTGNSSIGNNYNAIAAAANSRLYSSCARINQNSHSAIYSNNRHDYFAQDPKSLTQSLIHQSSNSFMSNSALADNTQSHGTTERLTRRQALQLKEQQQQQQQSQQRQYSEIHKTRKVQKRSPTTTTAGDETQRESQGILSDRTSFLSNSRRTTTREKSEKSKTTKQQQQQQPSMLTMRTRRANQQQQQQQQQLIESKENQHANNKKQAGHSKQTTTTTNGPNAAVVSAGTAATAASAKGMNATSTTGRRGQAVVVQEKENENPEKNNRTSKRDKFTQKLEEKRAKLSFSTIWHEEATDMQTEKAMFVATRVIPSTATSTTARNNNNNNSRRISSATTAAAPRCQKVNVPGYRVKFETSKEKIFAFNCFRDKDVCSETQWSQTINVDQDNDFETDNEQVKESVFNLFQSLCVALCEEKLMRQAINQVTPIPQQQIQYHYEQQQQQQQEQQQQQYQQFEEEEVLYEEEQQQQWQEDVGECQL